MNEYTPEVQAVRDRQITDPFQIPTLQLTTKRIEVSVYSDCIFIEFTDRQFVRFDLRADSGYVDVDPTIPMEVWEMASFKLITAEQYADQQRHDDEYLKFCAKERKATQEKAQHDEYLRLKAIYEP